jgi:hypothetical protein
VVGVDTHAKTHTYAITDAKTGQVLGTCKFPIFAAQVGEQSIEARYEDPTFISFRI